MVTKNGVPIGAAEMVQLKGQEALAVVPLMVNLPKIHEIEDGQLVQSTFDPKDVHIQKFTCEALGCQPGYLEYFKTFITYDYQIK
jgi:hypothetical protein